MRQLSLQWENGTVEWASELEWSNDKLDGFIEFHFIIITAPKQKPYFTDSITT